MSTCQELMEPVRQELAWRCEALPDGRTILVSTDRCFSDGDGMSLLVRAGSEDSVVVSDGGLVTGRLDLQDVPWDRQGSRLGRTWDDVRKSYGIEFSQGRLYLRGSAKSLPFMLARLADAAISLDVLTQVHNLSEEPYRFSAEVSRWLSSFMPPGVAIDEKFAVSDVSTKERYRFMKVTSPGGRSVLVKTIGGSSKQAAVTASYKVMFDLSRVDSSEWPKENKLAIIQKPEFLLSSHLDALSRSSRVGAWSHKKALLAYLNGDLAEGVSMI